MESRARCTSLLRVCRNKLWSPLRRFVTYNQQRLHSALDYLLPEEYEATLPRLRLPILAVSISSNLDCPDSRVSPIRVHSIAGLAIRFHVVDTGRYKRPSVAFIFHQCHERDEFQNWEHPASHGPQMTIEANLEADFICLWSRLTPGEWFYRFWFRAYGPSCFQRSALVCLTAPGHARTRQP